MIEFDCEGCGVHVLSFGPERVPKSHLCATCEFLCERVLEPDLFWSLYLRMSAGREARDATAARSITCPRCGVTSRHPCDIAEGYCGRCHDWTSEPCAPGSAGFEMGSSSAGPGEKPSGISS